jgi:hypothetical protein
MRDDLISAGVRLRLKHAAGELIAAAGGVSDVAALTGAHRGTVSRWQGAAYPETMPIEVAAALEMRLGRPIFTAILADLTGHECRPISDGEGAQPLERHLVRLAREGADAVAAMAEAAEDGNITPREAATLMRELAEVRIAATSAERSVAGYLQPKGG